jgi:hypothetical protein
MTKGYPMHYSIFTSYCTKKKSQMENILEKVFQVDYWNPERLAGVLLVSALLLLFLMLGLFAIRGNLMEVFAQIQGVTHNSFVRIISLSVWITAALLSLAGYTLLSTLLEREGVQFILKTAWTAMLIATVFLILEATIHVAFGSWAAEDLNRSEIEVDLYQVIIQWASITLQRVYVPVGYISLMLFGWAILRTDWLPDWSGWVTLAWGGSMLGMLLLLNTTLPATLLIPGALIGIVLLLNN